MRNLKGMAVLAGILALFVMPAFAVTSVADSVAVITDHSGTARIYTAGQWKNAEINMPLYEGDTVKTLSESALEVTFDDATIVKLGDDTELKLTELKRQGETATTIFNLLKGKFMAIVDKLKNPESRFEVHTKMAIAAVKGTELAVEAGDDGTNLGVYKGAVEFTGPNGGSISAKYKVMVNYGNESNCGSSGMPGKPAMIKYMGRFEREFGGLRETIRVVRELKAQGGDAVYKWRIQKKLMKNGEKIGDSETEGTIGGTNANVGQVKNQIQKALRAKLKKEMMNEKHHAYKDLMFVGEEMKADLHLGKTMTDVHGNRIRMEEFIFRPAENQVDLLTLTMRKGERLDYLRLQNIFINPLPVHPTKAQWRDMFKREWYWTVPANYLVEQSIKMSNIDDWVFIGTQYDGLYTVPGAIPKYVLPKNQEILAFTKSSAVAADGGIPFTGEMNTANFVDTVDNHQFVREHRTYATNPDGTQVVSRGILDKTYQLNTYTEYQNKMFLDFGATGNLPVSSNTYGKYEQGLEMADGVVEGDIAFKHTRMYNDGSWLALNMYLINDYGNPMRIDLRNIWTLLESVYNVVYFSNVEIMFKSNEFLQVENGIDIVSKLLWNLAINPKNVNNKTPVDYVYQ